MSDTNALKALDTLSLPDADGSEVGVETLYSPAGGIEIYTDACDEAMTRITPADARALAIWLNQAADKSEAAQATST